MWQSTTDRSSTTCFRSSDWKVSWKQTRSTRRTEDFLFPQNNTYFLFGKDEEGAALREDVDKALKEMKEDGTLSKITTEYLGVDTSPDEKYFDETPN